MSVPFSSFTISAPDGSFSYNLTSCDPDQPVSFDPVDPDCHKLSGYVGAGFGGRFPASVSLMVISYNKEPTKRDQNPIKLEIFRITPDQGEFTGDSAVLYGYFLEPYAQGLGFYLNQEQSQKGFKYGSSGIDCSIINTAITIK
ncbi:MAG TPA: hypothetical protein DCO75_12545 [Fibrobacteres bacterium]|jgi:hypothetical protein|nr:hypothetical protein [Fibrobacterota bacterium]